MTNVVIGTDNPIKRDAVLKAFNIYFDNVNIEMLNVESGVSKQPMNSKEIVKGAKNRIDNMKVLLGKDLTNYDFLIAVEAGIMTLSGKYYNIQFVVIENVKTGKKSSGFSQGVEIPIKYARIAMRSSINAVFRRVFGKSGEEEDSMFILTKGQVTRKTLLENGVIMALVGQINSEIW